MFSSPNGKPVWEDSFKQRKIKHINYFTLQQWSIAEQSAIKETVEEVSQCTGKNQCNTNPRPNSRTGMLKLKKKSPDEYNSNKSEQGEQDFPPISTKLHTEGHTIILNEQKVKPIMKHRNALTELHIGLHK